MKNGALLLASSLVLAYMSCVIAHSGYLDSNGICKKDGEYEEVCETCTCTKHKKPRCKFTCHTSTTTTTTTTTPPPPPPTCTVPICSDAEDCPAHYEPVCGIKVEFKTFPNVCILGGEGCEEGYRYFSDGKCLSAPPTTTSTTAPPITKDDAVNCDGICVLKGSFMDDCNTCNCTTIGRPPKCTKLVCPTKEPPCIIPTCSSHTICPYIYEPVCGIKIELRTFPNECFLGGEGCNEGFRYFKGGEC